MEMTIYLFFTWKYNELYPIHIKFLTLCIQFSGWGNEEVVSFVFFSIRVIVFAFDVSTKCRLPSLFLDIIQNNWHWHNGTQKDVCQVDVLYNHLNLTIYRRKVNWEAHYKNALAGSRDDLISPDLIDKLSLL